MAARHGGVGAADGTGPRVPLARVRGTPSRRIQGGYVVLNLMRYREKDLTATERRRRQRQREKQQKPRQVRRHVPSRRDTVTDHARSQTSEEQNQTFRSDGASANTGGRSLRSARPGPSRQETDPGSEVARSRRGRRGTPDHSGADHRAMFVHTRGEREERTVIPRPDALRPGRSVGRGVVASVARVARRAPPAGASMTAARLACSQVGARGPRGSLGPVPFHRTTVSLLERAVAAGVRLELGDVGELRFRTERNSSRRVDSPGDRRGPRPFDPAPRDSAGGRLRVGAAPARVRPPQGVEVVHVAGTDGGRCQHCGAPLVSEIRSFGMRPATPWSSWTETRSGRGARHGRQPAPGGFGHQSTRYRHLERRSVSWKHRIGPCRGTAPRRGGSASCVPSAGGAPPSGPPRAAESEGAEAR